MREWNLPFHAGFTEESFDYEVGAGSTPTDFVEDTLNIGGVIPLWLKGIFGLIIVVVLLYLIRPFAEILSELID